MNPALACFGCFVLIASYPDGSTTREAATTLSACMTAAEFYAKGRDTTRPKPVSVRCEQTSNPALAGFSPGWDCIKNYNCGASK